MSLMGCLNFINLRRENKCQKAPPRLYIRGPPPSPHRSFTTVSVKATLAGKTQVPLGTGHLVLGRDENDYIRWWFVSTECAHPVAEVREVIRLNSFMPQLGNDTKYIVDIPTQTVGVSMKLTERILQDGITDPDTSGKIMDLGYSVFSFMNPDWYLYSPNHYFIKGIDATGQHIGLWKIITDENNVVISAVFWHQMKW